MWDGIFNSTLTIEMLNHLNLRSGQSFFSMCHNKNHNVYHRTPPSRGQLSIPRHQTYIYGTSSTSHFSLLNYLISASTTKLHINPLPSTSYNQYNVHVIYPSHPQSAKAKRNPIIYTKSTILPMLMKMNEHSEYVREKPWYSSGLKNS